MARQSLRETRKLTVFVVVVVTSLLVIWWMNRNVRNREAGLDDGGDDPVKSALIRLARDPERSSMTVQPGTLAERQVRHTYAPIHGPVDVLELGQSDADHMSQTFFKNGIRFYNGFLSNSMYAYQYEVFRDLVNAQGAPRIILWDVRAAFLLRDGYDAGPDTPPSHAIWSAGSGPLYETGKSQKPLWYADIDSLLSLQQTELTVRWIASEIKPRGAPAVFDEDTGAPFRIVDIDKKSDHHRWLADGSRVYPGEVNGVVVAKGGPPGENGAGDRKVNALRMQRFEEYLHLFVDAGVTVIVYAPPMDARVPQPALWLRLAKEASDGIRAAAARVGVDFCDLRLEPEQTGCLTTDFYDEVHVSRHCNERIVRRLVSGCAPLKGAELRGVLAPALLE